ncbi:MAG TPA: hypothetical protein VN972_05300, partial [Methylomirabilota bacterium]|nr:hypothetical protein [Methylomirabilota bacterium]
AGEGKPGAAESGGIAIAAPRTGRGPRGTLSLDPPLGATVLFGCSTIAFAAAAVTGTVRRRRLRDPRRVRTRAMQTLLERTLARAASLATAEPAKAAAMASLTLLAGAGLRHDTDLAGLARAERRQRLHARGAAESEIAALEALFDSLAAIAYAPPETRSSDARQAILAVRETLERYRKEMEA